MSGFLLRCLLRAFPPPPDPFFFLVFPPRWPPPFCANHLCGAVRKSAGCKLFVFAIARFSTSVRSFFLLSRDFLVASQSTSLTPEVLGGGRSCVPSLHFPPFFSECWGGGGGFGGGGLPSQTIAPPAVLFFFSFLCDQPQRYASGFAVPRMAGDCSALPIWSDWSCSIA